MSITHRLAGTKEGGYDALIVIGPNVNSYDDPAVVAAKKVDAKFGSAIELLASVCHPLLLVLNNHSTQIEN